MKTVSLEANDTVIIVAGREPSREIAHRRALKVEALRASIQANKDYHAAAAAQLKQDRAAQQRDKP